MQTAPPTGGEKLRHRWLVTVPAGEWGWLVLLAKVAAVLVVVCGDEGGWADRQRDWMAGGGGCGGGGGCEVMLLAKVAALLVVMRWRSQDTCYAPYSILPWQALSCCLLPHLANGTLPGTLVDVLRVRS
jgi:hypothetical protein